MRKKLPFTWRFNWKSNGIDPLLKGRITTSSFGGSYSNDSKLFRLNKAQYNLALAGNLVLFIPSYKYDKEGNKVFIPNLNEPLFFIPPNKSSSYRAMDKEALTGACKEWGMEYIVKRSACITRPIEFLKEYCESKHFSDKEWDKRQKLISKMEKERGSLANKKENILHAIAYRTANLRKENEELARQLKLLSEHVAVKDLTNEELDTIRANSFIPAHFIYEIIDEQAERWAVQEKKSLIKT